MIELRDVLIASMAAAGAWAAVRIELRSLWRHVGGIERRLERLEDLELKERHT